MAMPNEVSFLCDGYHIDNLYRVCRLCFNRTSSRGIPKESVRQPLTQLAINRALKYYQIDFMQELADTTKPKVLCSGCRSRLANLETGKLTTEKWEDDHAKIAILPYIEEQQSSTRGTIRCKMENRCYVCQINASSLNNFLTKLKANAPRPGRPLEQPPSVAICSKCGMHLDNHDLKFCSSVFKYPQSSAIAGKLFAERVEARGYTSNVAVNYVKETLQLERKDISCSSNNPPIGLNHPYDSNNRLAITTVGYEGRGAVLKQLSVEAARDLQRLGHLGLGKNSYWELGRILRRDGISFPDGGIKRRMDEKWEIFGSIFTSIILPMVNKKLIPIQQPTPFGCCIDINNLLNIIIHSQPDSISRLKLQVDGGKDFLKMSVNIILMHPNSLYTPTPNSVLSNFVVAMGNAPENYHNLRELFTYSSIRKLFENDIPIQIACDFKVAALLVGIQQASSNYPCPFCLWRNGSLCTGLPDKARKHQDG